MSIIETLTQIWTRFEDLVYPQDVLCLCCDRALGEDAVMGVCPDCAAALEALGNAQEERETAKEKADDPLPEGIDYVHSAYLYRDQARELIHKLKYSCIRLAAKPLAEAMTMLPSGEEEIIVPIPTDKRRRRMRGYNQATLLAEHIASVWGMPMCEAVVRIRSCAPQTGLSEEERRRNLIGCMAVSPAHRQAVSGKRVLLVDDVYTTGSTVREAARALLEAGAVSVGVFTAARAGADQSGEKDPFRIHKEAQKPRNI